MRAWQNLITNRCYCVATGDLNLFKRNLLECLQEVTSSLRLFRVARSCLQIIKYFSPKHKLHRFEAGLKGAACFKIFQVILKSKFASFKRHMCLLSSVLSLLFGSRNDDSWFANLVLKVNGNLVAFRFYGDFCFAQQYFWMERTSAT